jgi:hypothetical protein
MTFTPQEHYDHALDLMTCIVANVDRVDFDAAQANALAQSAQAHSLLGLLKLGIDKRHDFWLEVTEHDVHTVVVTDPCGGGTGDNVG